VEDIIIFYVHKITDKITSGSLQTLEGHSQDYKSPYLIIQRNVFNSFTPNGHYDGRTAPLTSRRSILNIYATNIRTEYLKHAA
jgi:hypothetical protein